MEGTMIVKKALMNQIERMIKQKIGLNPDAQRLRRLENEVRTLRSMVYDIKRKQDDA
tara:strand:+ start:4276 stop:4446 length:171 start_codon:yes stop_codon:yes gene_type:complete